MPFNFNDRLMGEIATTFWLWDCQLELRVTSQHDNINFGEDHTSKKSFSYIQQFKILPSYFVTHFNVQLNLFQCDLNLCYGNSKFGQVFQWI